VAAIYPITLTVTTGNGCSTTISKNFTVNGSVPKASFHVLNAADLCSDRPVSLVNYSTVDFGNITRVDWIYDYVNKPGVVETDNNPYYGKLYQHQYPLIVNPVKTQNYQVRMMAYSGTVCASEKDTVITVLAGPQLVFPAVAALCKNGGPYQLSAAETTGIPGNALYLGKGVNTSGLFNPAVAGVGTSTVQYIFTSANGCADTISSVITVNDAPTVNAGPDLNILDGGHGSFQASAAGDSLSYLWTPDINLSNNKILNPEVTPGQTDILYTLTVTNNKGCSASGNVMVKVLKSPMIPSAFTPNGDGINDTWVIKYLESYVGATVEVFNRYGQKVYSSVGYSIPWDGRYNNALLPAGVYYYLINPGHGRKTFSGSVTIIR
jgi:gliding motility-associated-like protein